MTGSDSHSYHKGFINHITLSNAENFVDGSEQMTTLVWVENVQFKDNCHLSKSLVQDMSTMPLPNHLAIFDLKHYHMLMSLTNVAVYLFADWSV